MLTALWTPGTEPGLNAKLMGRAETAVTSAWARTAVPCAILGELLKCGGNSAVVPFPALTRAFALLLEFGIESPHVETHGFLIGDLLGEVERESERVVQLEDFGTGNRRTA